MKIIMINKYHQITGGGDTYYFQLSNLLRSKGHKVIELCIDHPKNSYSEYSEYFINGLTYDNWRTAGFRNKAKTFINGIYNVEAKKKVKLLIEKTAPDIAHIHNIFYQISPSILTPLKEAGIPIVQTLHDYNMICASNYMYNKGEICQKCYRNRYYNILINRCFHDSIPVSMLAFFAKVIHHYFQLYQQKIDVFISPSHFLKDKLVANGIRNSKITVLPHPIDLNEYDPNYDEFEDYVIFAGTFIKQKGIRTLIKAFESLPIKLLLLGTGPLWPEIKNYVKTKKIKNIELTGFLQGENFKNMIKNAKFVVVPSEWYENSPLIIYESFAMGKPVIASNMGGMPELVDQKVGRLFKMGDIEDIRVKVKELYYNDDLIKTLGRNARTKAEGCFANSLHYGRIKNIYQTLLDKKTKGHMES